jgi:hypothetical protein
MPPPPVVDPVAKEIEGARKILGNCCSLSDERKIAWGPALAEEIVRREDKNTTRPQYSPNLIEYDASLVSCNVIYSIERKEY